VPRALVWNGEGAVGRSRAGRQELTKECQAFRGVLAAKAIICRPGDPEGQGTHRTLPRLSGAFVSARRHLRLVDRFQRSAGRLADRGQHPHQAGAGLRGAHWSMSSRGLARDALHCSLTNVNYEAVHRESAH
jgi:hypothetical protein